MKIKRIHIVGGPGSGKTFVAKKLSSLMKIPWFDLDDLYWDRSAKSYDIKTPEKLRNRKFKSILKKDEWIVEGVYYKWTFPSFKKADIIMIIKTGVFVRDWRIIKRFIKRKLGLIKSKKEKLKDLINMIKWNHRYNDTYLVETEKFIKQFKKKIVCFRGSHEAMVYLIKPRKSMLHKNGAN